MILLLFCVSCRRVSPLVSVFHLLHIMMLHRDIPKATTTSLGRRLTWPKATLSTAVDYLGVPGLRKPKDFPRLATAAVMTTRDTLGAWDRADHPHNVVNMIDGVSNSLCRIGDTVTFVYTTIIINFKKLLQIPLHCFRINSIRHGYLRTAG